MATSVTTIFRRLGTAPRVLMFAVLLTAFLLWQGASFRAWGAMAFGLTVTMVLWLVWQLLVGRRCLPANGVYFVWLGAALILLIHVLVSDPPVRPGELAGAVENSLITHLAMLTLGTLLVQSLLTTTAWLDVILSLCGAAMIGGSILSLLAGVTTSATSLALIGWAGVGCWLMPIWMAGRAQEVFQYLGERTRLLYAIPGLAGGMVLAAAQPRVLGIVVVTAALAAIFGWRRHPRRVWIVGLAVLAGAAGAWAIYSQFPVERLHAANASFWGAGEDAFGAISVSDPGWLVVVSVVGWFGLMWLGLGMLAVAGWAARAGESRKERKALWLSVTVLSTAALLGTGGMWIPAVTAAVMLSWGVMPTAVGRSDSRAYPRWCLFAASLALILLLGTARQEGLVLWMANALGGSDKVLHAGAGLILAMQLAWLMGLQHWRWGLIGIAVLACLGLAGEAVQWLGGDRSVEMVDWLYHVLGAALAAGIYVLAMGAAPRGVRETASS